MNVPAIVGPPIILLCVSPTVWMSYISIGHAQNGKYCMKYFRHKDRTVSYLFWQPEQPENKKNAFGFKKAVRYLSITKFLVKGHARAVLQTVFKVYDKHMLTKT